MTLGEKIYENRTRLDLSQGDLADMLEVSRQSVSKWENGAATPDLDKIIKLAEIFGMTIDELVKGEAEIEKPIQPAETQNARAEKQSAFPPRKIVGTILFCFAAFVAIFCSLLGGFIEGLIFSSPFVLCGIICFVFKRNVGLWCAWAVFFAVDMYIRFATGLGWRTIRHTFIWSYDMNYARLAIAWAQFLTLAVLVVITVLRFRKIPLESKRPVLILWAAYILTGLGLFIFSKSEVCLYIITNIISYSAAYTLCLSAFDWLRAWIFTAAVVFTVRFIFTKRNKNI